MRLTFLGAAGEVTGSCCLVETQDVRFLVDCGMFQGGREAEAKNRAAFLFAPADLDFVLVTHAHLDHCGLLPRLVAAGYRRPIIATHATADLLPIMLGDSAHIQEKELARQQWRAHAEGAGPAEAPLYTTREVDRACALVQGRSYTLDFEPHSAVRARFSDAGHILGAAIVEIWIQERMRETKLVFSGDLGQPARPLVRDPAPIEHADILLVESTYGNRNHKGIGETVDELVEAVRETIERHHGNLIVPAFALGRTQELLVLLGELVLAGRLPRLNVFVDSPLASRATEVTLRHADLLDESARRVLREALDGRLPLRLRFTEDVEDSKSLNAIRSGAIIIAASGMCEAGRIKHHLERNLARPECAVLFTGFQAKGTLGRRIVDGARSVRLFRDEVPVRARIHTLGGLSAHADQRALLAWLAHFGTPPRACYAVHGEAEIAANFAAAVRGQFGWSIEVPEQGQTVEL